MPTALFGRESEGSATPSSSLDPAWNRSRSRTQDAYRTLGRTACPSSSIERSIAGWSRAAGLI